MKRTLSLVGITALLALTLLVPAGTTSASPTAVAARHTVFAFALIGPNTAIAPDGGMMAAPGDEIEVTGGGTFTPATAAISAGGRFTHRTADGTVHCQGTWTATALTGWTDLGAGRRALRDGVIAMLVTHRCATMDEVHTDIPMTVTSAHHAAPGSGAVTGVTVGEFTRPTGGHVLIVRHGGRP